jgi:arylsulfatase A-like enzyme
MHRLLYVVVAMLILVTIGADAAHAADRPNILFVITDDQRWDSLGLTGHPFLETPNMDRIGREGAHFRNAFVTTPLCSPARGSFLTGQYAHKHLITGNSIAYSEQSHRLVTFPMYLQRAGYYTGYVGKWHMGKDASARPGFDHWISFAGQGTFNDPVLNINGQTKKHPGYLTDIISDFAADFIRKSHDGKPFMLYVSHKAVHSPYTPAERHKDLYSDEPLPRRANVKADISGKPMLTREGAKPPPAGGPVKDQLIRDQLRCLRSVDEGLGKILAALEETGQLDRTLVIFTSDNGYFWNEHRLGDKRAAYEEAIRIPLLMRYPPLIKPGTTIETMVLNIDIAPTLLALAGADRSPDMHGRSLLPLLAEPHATLRDAALLENFHDPRFPHIAAWQAIRTPNWKYIHYPDLEGMDELYNLESDPFEMSNLIDAPEAADVLRTLRDRLAQSLRETP